MNGILTFSQWTQSAQLNENLQAAKSYMIRRYAEKNKLEEITPEDEKNALTIPDYKEIMELLKSNKGYYYAFVRFRFEYNVPMQTLRKLYDKIKENAGSLNSLPMSIEEYSNHETVNGVPSVEALLDQFDWIEQRRKLRWIIDKVNRDLRTSIKQLSPEKIDRLYRAADLIDKADAKAGNYIDPVTGKETNTRLSLLKKSNAFSDGDKYLEWVEEMAQNASNADLSDKINAIRSLEPESGIIYNDGGYLAISVRTEKAQKELCSIANWCINRGSWSSYGGKEGSVQINIFNFKRPITDPLHITGTTIYENKTVHTAHDKNDDYIGKSNDPYKHFIGLGYPEDLAQTIIDVLDREIFIKKIVTGLGIDTSSPSKLLLTIIKATYKMDIESQEDVRNIMVGIIRDQIGSRISRGEVIENYMKYGVLSTFSARILNILVPDLSDEEKRKILDNNDQIINSPRTGLKVILLRKGRDYHPSLTSAVDNEEKIKDLILTGDAISDEGY